MSDHNRELIESVERLKSMRIIKRDIDIANATGYSKGVVSNYLSGRVDASENFIEKFNTVYKDYLKQFKNNVSNISEPLAHYGKQKSIPFYDIDVSASGIEMFSDTPEFAIKNISIPGFEDCEFAVPVYGHSMYPTYENGVVVLCKKIRDMELINYGECYLVITKDYRMVKRVMKSDTDENVSVISDNKEGLNGNGKRKYEDFEVPKKKILHLYMIKGTIKRAQGPIIHLL